MSAEKWLKNKKRKTLELFPLDWQPFPLNDLLPSLSLSLSLGKGVCAPGVLPPPESPGARYIKRRTTRGMVSLVVTLGLSQEKRLNCVSYM